MRITLIDCLGRSFPDHHHLINVDVNVFTNNPEIAEAILDGNSGMIGISGYKLGKTHLVVEVTVDGILKARDVLPVSINLLIMPSRPVTVHSGGIIKFGVPDSVESLLKNKNNRNEKWSSGD